MARTERTLQEVLFGEGYGAGALGAPEDECPYTEDSAEREWWLEGWHEGREDWIEE